MKFFNLFPSHSILTSYFLIKEVTIKISYLELDKTTAIADTSREPNLIGSVLYALTEAISSVPAVPYCLAWATSGANLSHFTSLFETKLIGAPLSMIAYIFTLFTVMLT